VPAAPNQATLKERTVEPVDGLCTGSARKQPQLRLKVCNQPCFTSSNEAEFTDNNQLLLEGAKFADQHGFTAVWTPERHFHAFVAFTPVHLSYAPHSPWLPSESAYGLAVLFCLCKTIQLLKNGLL